MYTTHQTYQTKIIEVEEYYKFLKDISLDNAKLHYPTKKTWRYKTIDEELKKILKANCFLILYNLVESTVRIGIFDIFDAIANQDLAYADLRIELRKFWVQQRYRDLGQAAHPDRYRDLAHDLIESAMNNLTVELNRTRLPRGGNLNAHQIRQICEDLGFRFRAHKASKGGEKLETVRKMRNQLAHGLESFSECGRSYTYDDLHKIKKETVVYLNSFMRTIDLYLRNRRYRS